MFGGGGRGLGVIFLPFFLFFMPFLFILRNFKTFEKFVKFDFFRLFWWVRGGQKSGEGVIFGQNTFFSYFSCLFQSSCEISEQLRYL